MTRMVEAKGAQIAVGDRACVNASPTGSRTLITGARPATPFKKAVIIRAHRSGTDRGPTALSRPSGDLFRP